MTIIGSPTGRQPWETRGWAPRPGGSARATAPSRYTSSSRKSRLPPGRLEADARPPTRVNPGGTLSASVTPLKENGSARATTAVPSTSPSGRGPSGGRRKTSTGPVSPAHRTMPGDPSTSCRWARTETAVPPMRWLTPSVRRTVRPTSSPRSMWWPVRNRTATSDVGPSRSRTWPTTSPRAMPVSGCSDSATA